MIRLYLGLIVLGGFLVYLGYQEFTLASKASPEPVLVEMASLEAGEIPEERHLRIGQHWAVYPYWVGYGEEDTDQLDYVYYPIISEQHPFNLAVDAAIAEHGDGNVPPEEWPVFESCAVLVKTKDYARVGEVPDGWDQPDSVQGLVINGAHRFNQELGEILQTDFPKIDLDRVVVLERGRLPQPMTTTYAMMGGGALLVVAGLGLIIRRR